MSKFEPEKSATQQWTRDTMFRSNYSTLAAIIAMTAVAAIAWANLGFRLSRIEQRLDGVIYQDDLDRYSAQMEIHNQQLHLVLPESYEITRRHQASIDPPSLSPSAALSRGQ